jgi:hypothetical protein
MATRPKRKAGGPSRGSPERRERTGRVAVSVTMALLHQAQAGALAQHWGYNRSQAVVRAIMAAYAAEIGDVAPWQISTSKKSKR